MTLCGSSRCVDIMAASPYSRLADFLRWLKTLGQGRRLAALTDARGVQLVLREVEGVPEVGAGEFGANENGALEDGVRVVSQGWWKMAEAA